MKKIKDFLKKRKENKQKERMMLDEMSIDERIAYIATKDKTQGIVILMGACIAFAICMLTLYLNIFINIIKM